MGEWFEIIEGYFWSYSVLWIGVLLLGIAAFALLRERRTPGGWIAFGTLVAILLVGWMTLHPRQSRLSENAAQIIEQIGKGTPVLLEFQSPFCISCTLLRPLVDEIEQKYHGRLIVIRVDIQSASGRELTHHFGFEYTPTFIFFDAQGQERWRSVGELDPNKVAESLSIP